MIIVKKSGQRRHIVNEHQDTWVTFDSNNKADPLRHGFSSLFMFNEDILTLERPLKLHPVKEMVIVTYVQAGVVIYHGPLWGTQMLEPGDFHRIHVAPDEDKHQYDAILTGDTHIFQGGFTPDLEVLEPKGKKIFFSHGDRHANLRLIASPDGREASMPIRRDVQLYSTFIPQGHNMEHPLQHDRSAWLHVVKGRVMVNQTQLQTGDGAGFTGESLLSFSADEPTEILLFDLADPVPGQRVAERRKEVALSRN